MLQNVNKLTELVQVLELDVAGPQSVVQDGAQGLGEQGQGRPISRLPREEGLKQLVLHGADLDTARSLQPSGHCCSTAVMEVGLCLDKDMPLMKHNLGVQGRV